MDQTFEYDVFLSFSGEDQESAKGIFTQLASYGVKVFFANETLKSEAGHNFFFRIQTGLEKSQHFLLAATRNAIRSPWVQAEYSAFYMSFHLNDGGRRRFFILILDKDFDRRGLPLFLRSLQISESVEAIAKIVQAQLSKTPAPFLEEIGRFEENLLSLFGNHRVESIDASLLRQYLGNRVDEMLLQPRLLRTFETVRSLKQDLQALGSPYPKSLIGGIVKLLSSAQHPDPLKARFLYELVRRTYYPKWSQSQVDGFDRAAKALLTWRDVYVSYTNRDAPVVNSEYRHAIRQFLTPSELHDERGSQNLVARAVLHLLARQNLSVNDKYHEIMDGQDISVLMESQVKNSFFLIQLLERASFVAGAGQRNWMFEEYHNFMTSVRAAGEEIFKGRFLPVILGKNLEAITPVRIPIEYQSWCDHIRSVDCLILPASGGHELQSRISEIAGHVASKQRELVESMAQSWLLL